MLYRLGRKRSLQKFTREIAGILDTPPMALVDAPWCIASMVANRDVEMYLVAVKSFYRRLGSGKVVAIIDRAMPQALRDTLSRHLVGIEFAILEDIPTDPCQRGGTWERLLYCLDRSATEYTIQIDADTLTVGDDVQEVVTCLQANRAFTISDGFCRVSLPEAAEIAQATPSEYIGISTEAAFDRYPGGERLSYIRGSSGFAGFAKGGYTRALIADFHREMEALVGAKRWREWGSEQCGSNFSIANSPDPLVLPYPEYASFNGRVLRHEAKLFHFIGRFRFTEGYFARRSQEVITALTPGAAAVPPPPRAMTSAKPADPYPLLFARSLAPASLARYAAWRMAGATKPVVVQMRARTEFQGHPPPGPRLQLRSAADATAADEVFVQLSLFPPVWIPPERVKWILDLGPGVGMSCLWWLANYWRARVTALEPHPDNVAQAGVNVALNGDADRFELHQAAELFAAAGDRRIDILKIDVEGGEAALLDDPRFAALHVGAVVIRWRNAGRDRCVDRLRALGFRTYVTADDAGSGTVWGYRNTDAGLASG